MKESLRIVVGTNVWISYLIGKNTRQLENIILDDKIKIFASSKLLHELFSVLNSTKFSKLIPKIIIEELSFLSEIIFELIKVKSHRNEFYVKEKYNPVIYNSLILSYS